LDNLAEGGMLGIETGEIRVVVCRAGGNLHAMDGTCPHRGAPLMEGALHGTTVVCPWHAWEFDCATGQYGMSPGLRLQTYPVRVEDGEIIVDA
jgi:nitrite reductase/ring-hydroxylating ferredoxin subunit